MLTIILAPDDLERRLLVFKRQFGGPQQHHLAHHGRCRRRSGQRNANAAVTILIRTESVSIIDTLEKRDPHRDRGPNQRAKDNRGAQADCCRYRGYTVPWPGNGGGRFHR